MGGNATHHYLFEVYHTQTHIAEVYRNKTLTFIQQSLGPFKATHVFLPQDEHRCRGVTARIHDVGTMDVLCVKRLATNELHIMPPDDARLW